MKNLIALALFASLPGLAQAQTTWTGQNLSISGNRTNGCDLRIVEVTHGGSMLSSLRFVVFNRATTAVRVNADVTMTGNNQRKSGPITGVIGANQQAALQGFYPFGGSLAGSTVAIRFTGCSLT
ncbi:hypothetical protein [Sediminicoccus sp. BL-A-41-H5]|jgi:hypothetical protein|uniref:hypothetical protein n=1 Tax=Sediminicoccus sp. BL-A-41-H5 TaxID=3421106 RepID=UPI003D665C4B